MHHLTSLKHYHPQAKRAITRTDQFLVMSFPLYGIGQAFNELTYMASALEHLANETALEARATGQALAEVPAELVAVRTVALQNRVALDYLLAYREEHVLL
ncbi:hypothetical protein chiPu_0025317 [Chiloscyllium punctatum]|uniref:Uncharacterized protein n=1 Tax=Chiloscyllium punctatum TaxID=137246 RepID=A0A401TEI6_CHIPU|nr:hypothetical protein [Chiloscyllium punctatum]